MQYFAPKTMFPRNIRALVRLDKLPPPPKKKRWSTIVQYHYYTKQMSLPHV